MNQSAYQQANMMYNNPYLGRMNFPTTPINQNNGINWVQGIEGAKAWQLNPNSNIQLMDSDNDGIMYIKTCDNAGMSALRVFRYEEITDKFNKSSNVNLDEYVRKDELQALISTLVGGTQNEQTVPTTKSNSKSKNVITE